MRIAAAQTIPKDGDIATNINDHCRLAELAAENGIQLLVFPEMSLTGYQRSLARDYAFNENDSRLDQLRAVAISKKIIIVAGAPVKIKSELHIGAFVLFPDNIISIYTKQFLHEQEEDFFSPNFEYNPQVKLDDEIISLAICADIANLRHPEHAATSGSTIYLPCIFYTPSGIVNGHERLSGYAKKHSMHVLMSNYGGPSWGLESGGKSAFWTNDGALQGSLGSSGEGLLIAAKEYDGWTCETIGMQQ